LWLITAHNWYKDKKWNIIKRVEIEEFLAIKEHLDNYFDKISKRDDQWDTSYNLRSCAYMDNFSKQKIIYSETNNSWKTKITFDDKWYITDKTAFILKWKNDEEIKFIYSILSSSIFTWYIRLTSPVLWQSWISLTKESVEKFPLCPFNWDYWLTNEEIDFMENSFN
jgi:hypothetical protein